MVMPIMLFKMFKALKSAIDNDLKTYENIFYCRRSSFNDLQCCEKRELLEKMMENVQLYSIYKMLVSFHYFFSI